jgi:hypothetical protein
MTLFHHHGGFDSQYIAQFQIRQGDRSAGLSWKLRDSRPREVLIFQSTLGFVEDDVDPISDDRQRLVYRGTELNARLTDAVLTDDIAYYYPDDMSTYYSVFARGDDGNVHLQLVAQAMPRSVGSWECPGSEGGVGSEKPQEIAAAQIDHEARVLPEPPTGPCQSPSRHGAGGPMELQAINITIDDRTIAAPGWLEVDDTDDPHAWELSVRGPISGDLHDAPWGTAEDVFAIQLTVSQGRRCRGQARLRKANDSPAGTRELVMTGEGPLEFLA